MSSLANLVARADDTDDVRWALQTALVQLKQGGPADAIVWVKRAAEAAEAAGYAQRAVELRAQARQLAEQMWNLGSGTVAGANPSRPPSSGSVEIEIDMDMEEVPAGSVRPASSSAPPISHRGASAKPPPLRPPPGARGFSDSPGRPPPLAAAPTVMGFAAPDIERASLTETSPYRSSVPELEARELDADPLFTTGMPSEPARPSGAGRITSVSSAPQSIPAFNDRLSSVDIQPLSVDSVIPSFPGLPGEGSRPVSMPPAPESVRRALALIDDEEILEDEEDERVTQDFGILTQEGRSPSGLPRASQRPSESPRGGSVAPFSTRTPDSQRGKESQRGALLPPAAPSSAPPPRTPAPLSLPPAASPALSVPPAASSPLSSPPALASTVAPPPPSRPSFGAPPSGVPPSGEPFLRTPSSRPPDVARLSRRAPPAPADALNMDLGELTLEVSDLGPPGSKPSSRSGGHDALPADVASADDSPPSTPPQADPTAPTTVVDGIALEALRGFEDLPVEVQQGLARSVRIQPLDAGDEVGFFGAAVVTAGSVDILPAISDDSGAVAETSDVVFTKSSLPDSIALRVVAKIDGTRVATWDPDVFEAAIQPCPWLHDELRFIADYFVAVCGAALGPLGERLDPALRTAVFKRLEVRALQADEVLIKEGANIASLFVVGGGRLLVEQGGADPDELLPGGFVFAEKMMTAKPAPATVRAGAQGALVLYAPRAVAHELMMSVPPLLEVLAG
jgi:hypothetical protein